MSLFVLSLIAAIVSGRFVRRFDENRNTYLSVCMAASVMAFTSGTRLIPDAVWIAFAPYIFGTLLVLSFWTLRTQLRRMLLK